MAHTHARALQNRSRYCLTQVTVLSAWLLAALPLAAHNGALTLARPAPQATTALPWTAFGRPPDNPRDLTATLRASWSATDLLVTVEVTDQSTVIDTSPHANWDTQDGCEIYVSWQHDGQVQQIRMYGDGAAVNGLGVVRRGPGRSVYEFRIPAPDSLRAGRVIGFDAAVCDRDADGSFTWQVLGRGEQKMATGRVGDLLLLPAGAATGQLEAMIVSEPQWASEGLLATVALAVEAADAIQVRAGMGGRLVADLPVGAHGISLPHGRISPDRVTLATDDTTEAEFHVQLPPMPATTMPATLRSQPAATGRRSGAMTEWGQADGLPVGAIADLLRVGENHLWIASQGGAVRFDGTHMRVLHVTDDNSPVGVQSLMQDRHGNIWLGTGWQNSAGIGVLRYDGKSITRFGPAEGLAHGSVLCLLEDRHGDIWVGTYAGLSRFDGRHWRTYTVEDGLGDNVVMALFEDATGTIWVGTGYGRSGGYAGGVSRFDGRRFTTYTMADGLPSNWVSAITQDRAGVIWAGTLGAGVARFDGQRFHVPSDTSLSGHRADPAPMRVWDMTPDGAGLLLATDSGLLRVKNDQLRAMPWPRPAAAVAILDLSDPDVLWLATHVGTLERWTPALLRSYADPAKLTRQIVRIETDRDGDLWVPAATGLLRVVGDSLAPFAPAAALGEVLSTHKDRSGSRWLVTPTGLSRLAGDHLRAYDDELPAVPVTSMHEDAQGRLWVGTRSGAARFEGGSFHTLRVPDGLPHARIVGFTDDGTGGVWIGTGGGLVRWLDGYITPAPAGLDGVVGPLLTDRSGRAWMRVAGGIASVLDGHVQIYTETAGVPDRLVTMAAETDDGTIWIGTAHGPARLTDRGFEALKAESTMGRITSIQQVGDEMWFGTDGRGVLRYDGTVLQRLTEAEGLSGNYVYDIGLAPAGHVWIATNKGVSRYRRRPGQPLITLDDVATDHLHGPVSHVSLSTAQDYLAFRFHASSLVTDRSTMRYMHRLLPTVSEWQFSSDGQAIFEDVARGRHTLEVIALDQDFGRSEPLRVAVEVHLPYERIAWIWALVLAVLLLVVQGSKLLQRDRRLRDTNQDLSAANQVLSAEVHRREQAEADRSRLGSEVEALRYLDRLRTSLEAQTEDLLAAAGGQLAESLALPSDVRIQISCDQRVWSQEPTGTLSESHRYEADLTWGERRRGGLTVECAITLDEGQRRAYVDETAAQLARTLETRELTAQLLQSARLVALGQMAAGVAHELNQPLAAVATIAGDVHLRLLEQRDLPEELLKEMMSDIAGLVRRMSGTIDHLRLFSRDSSREPGVQFCLNDVVQASLKVLGTQLANQGIELVLKLEQDLPVIFGQPFQLEQVMLNLLANARDAIEQRPVDVPTPSGKVTVTTWSDEGRPLVEVTDNGIGILPADREHLFEPFFTTKPADRGTGLGLSISYAIVLNHGGTITCDSSPGAGSTFRVTLTAAQPQEA